MTKTIEFEAVKAPNGSNTRSTLIKVDGAVVGQIKSQGPKSHMYRVTVLLQKFIERGTVFSYKGAQEAAREMVEEAAA